MYTIEEGSTIVTLKADYLKTGDSAALPVALGLFAVSGLALAELKRRRNAK